MICRYCGTELPEGAMFCGECGRAVSGIPAGTATATAQVIVTPTATVPELEFSAAADGEPVPALQLPVDEHSAARCPQCGEPVSANEVFCGECGFVLRTPEPPAAGPRDTISLEPLMTEPAMTEPVAEPEPEPVAEPEAEPVAEPAPEPVVAPAPEPVVAPDAEVEPEPAATPPAERAEPRRPAPDPFPWGLPPTPPTASTPRRVIEDLETTRMLGGEPQDDRFVLQFSTGESIVVSGLGLIGRNPEAQPGEYVDQMIPIFDAGKSVSKTHLEFGQESGRFWISDRYSTNGSVVRQPDLDPRRCEPGRRYFVARGTRVDIGEQFFVVS